MVKAVIVAAGRGERMGPGQKKQYADLCGMPVAARALAAFDACPLVDALILAVPESEIKFCLETLVRPFGWRKPVAVTAGGDSRQESVFKGLAAAGPDTRVAVIHDGVRPFVTDDMIRACVEGARQSGACIVALEAHDTLKKADNSGRITSTLDRKNVWMAQTPQAFSYELILAAHQRAARDGFLGTDDAELVERLGHAVAIVRGSRENIKITTIEDLALARAWSGRIFGRSH